MSAEDRGWGPAPASRDHIVAVAAPESGAEFPGGVHEGIADLVRALLVVTESQVGYLCRPGECWGYAARRISGSNTWSNHAWGLAVDINAPANPMGDRLVTDMPPDMPKVWQDCGFRWGGNYQSRPDAMHYEYMHRPEDVPMHLERARGHLQGSEQQSTDEQEDDVTQRGDQGADVRRLQGWGNIALHGTQKQGMTIDGSFGEQTEKYVYHLEKLAGRTAKERTGKVNAALWSWLESVVMATLYHGYRLAGDQAATD